MTAIPPDLTARGDQMRAACSEDLDKLVQEYRAVLADDIATDANVAFGYLVAFIRSRLGSPSGECEVVFTLAATIERLAR